LKVCVKFPAKQHLCWTT